MRSPALALKSRASFTPRESPANQSLSRALTNLTQPYVLTSPASEQFPGIPTGKSHPNASIDRIVTTDTKLSRHPQTTRENSPLSAPPELSGSQINQEDVSEPGSNPLTDENSLRVWTPGRSQLRMLL